MLQCPHCLTQVPRGAHVCTGCAAELHYGIPEKLLAVGLIAATIAGLYVGNGMNGGAVVGTIAGFMVFGGIYACLQKVFKDRVVFKRNYRTTD
ncbi:hypothetical protein [Paraburkholderia caballeronis]|uniref:Uncharacterized protein n=1 Tax=Paraburkholderia caballeronis TaxID=416943 RepID=A0A1H7VRB5_9BURK|nr:hypothetical protein [Paraburkholderia caballeronis]PXW15502.1 hypothetical protein C7403_12565 [Paraburkholderia caballeronis]PXW93787.1 hypothetical protein C7407_12565 [Paraburkholderia caballeronis]RAJ89027.1 hypothetical protein C7409_12565 [Paraburkholderia caballeronis]SEE00044.1 hypothetical protein SAMN05445871_4438 [Paraburkholderia caballeronis]SEM11756.1 hypothetical protein SAMN05192542_1279 [Paraburkholderia caballeronis]